MLESKAVISKALENKYIKVMNQNTHKEDLNSLTRIIEQKHGIPIRISNDYISLLKKFVDAPNEYLYCFMEAIDTNALPKYFDAKEIKKYEKYKYNSKKLKFPLAFEATQISDNQWIGRITVQELVNLFPVINYNTNTQRSLRRNTINGVEVYSIFLNEKAISEITESYLNQTYIPNTITLNIPEDVDFEYKEGNLIFKSLEKLDIIDGYHRYIAMTRAYSADTRFDYPMEVRWTVFSEDIARQFIWQEDQKTKMKRVESEAFNQNNSGNQLINMLNQVTTLKDIVSVNGNVNAGIASEYINAFWFNKLKHIYSRKEIVEVKKIIEKYMLNILDQEPDAFDKKWNPREIGALFLTIYNDDIESLFDFIDYINKEELPIHSSLTKREITRLKDSYQKFKA